jgi:Ankyrin repeats (many copies)/SAM domain (Sterile alpha motif)
MANIQIILNACRKGDLNTLKSILDKDSNSVNETSNELGWTGLYCSVMCGHDEISEYLLTKSADVNFKNRMGETPLHQAVTSKNIKMVEMLLSYKADPNIQQNDGETALHLAVLNSHYKIICVLLENNADPSIPDYVYSKSPMQYAIEKGNAKIIKEMLKYTPDTDIKPNLSLTLTDLNRHSRDKPASTISPEPSEFIMMTQQLSPMYTRCNSEISLFNDCRGIDTKIKQIEMMHKKIREAVRTSVDTVKRVDHSISSVPDDSDKTLEPKSISSEAKPELYRWLKALKLLEEYNLLVQAGYDDINQLIKQMKSSLPLTENSLIKIGMKKPGHRRKLLATLEALSNKENETGILNSFQCCLAIPSSLWLHNSIPLDQWLEDLNLIDLLEYFKEAGFEELEDLTGLVNTPWNIDDQLLADIGVDKPGYRHRILAKLRESSSAKKSEDFLIEKSANTTACEICNIM